MLLEPILAFLHISAILTLVVFITSEAALTRSEWLNAAVVERLARIDIIYAIAAALVLATGLLRVYLGVKGSDWYWSQWLLHAKIGLFVLIALISIKPTLAFRRWVKALRATGALPGADEVRNVRRWVMMQAHLIALIPLLAVFLARQ